VLGVTGGISAYKAILVCRRLIDGGAHVMPIMTEAATRFVGPTTLTALASEPVRMTVWDDEAAIAHTRMGQVADLVLVCPATARLLGSYAAGISDDLLTTTLIATRAPVIVCPAMHTEMWEHPAIQDNLSTLVGRGVHVVDPGVGVLAGGDIGAGRLAEPDEVMRHVVEVLSARSLAGASGGASREVTGSESSPAAVAGAPGGTPSESTGAPARDLVGLRVLVSAGGTREAIDPVRFIGNRSTGKQGIALAEAAADRGAEVVLVATVAGPVRNDVRTVSVESAAELASAVHAEAPSCDVVVMAAAVADFRPVEVAEHKIKKTAPAETTEHGTPPAPTGSFGSVGSAESSEMSQPVAPSSEVRSAASPGGPAGPGGSSQGGSGGLEGADGTTRIVLERTEDVLASLGADRVPGRTLVGFAAETERVLEHARGKRERKGADLIVANDVSESDAGFGHDTNRVTIVGEGWERSLPLGTKREVADAIWDAVTLLRSPRGANGSTPGGVPRPTEHEQEHQ